MRLLLGLIVFCLLVFGCLGTPNENVCPDGKVVTLESQCSSYTPQVLDLNPSDYPAVELRENTTNYVESGGKVNITIDMTGIITAYVFTGDTLSRGFSMPEDYKVNDIGDLTIRVNGNYSSVNLTRIKDQTYWFESTAPRIPGDYIVSVGRPVDASETFTDYNLTVISQVPDETAAYKIADRFMDSCLPKSMPDPYPPWTIRGRGGWEILDKTAISEDGYWDVSLKAQNAWCGLVPSLDGIEQYGCVRYSTVTGHYKISKATGQIIG